MGTTAEQFWWTDFFDDTYAEIGLVSSTAGAEETRSATARFLFETLQLAEGDTVFDQCCGVGRLSLPLAALGVRVIGVDQAPSYAPRAQHDADAAQLPATFYTADAFEFVAPTLCDAAFNWFTSFGYHEDDVVNRRMLDRAHESLRPGGWFALEYVSVPLVLREFRACQLNRFQFDGEELWLIQEPEFDFAAGMIRCNWTFIRPDESHEVRRVANRAYMPAELVELFRAAGFVNIELFGSIDSVPFDRTSRRCIVVGQKSPD